MRSMFLSQRDQQKEISLVKHDTMMKTKMKIQIFILIKIPKKFKPEKKEFTIRSQYDQKSKRLGNVQRISELFCRCQGQMYEKPHTNLIKRKT